MKIKDFYYTQYSFSTKNQDANQLNKYMVTQSIKL